MQSEHPETILFLMFPISNEVQSMALLS